MPMYDIRCRSCGGESEVLVAHGELPTCPSCGKKDTEIMLSVSRVMTKKNDLPGPNDHGCCGSRPSEAGCAGPGTCCGKNR
ncbi:MAG: FmdB family zinc ribbon protein [Desulfovibrionales bacterium]